jgi:hypothetical protein
MIIKRYHQHWVFESPEAVLTCSILNCNDKKYLIFGGHDKNLYLMDLDLTILDDTTFDGWVRCSYTTDIDGDGCEEILVGSGDGRALVLKLDKEHETLFGIMNNKFDGKINCCIAGDLYRDGNIELIFGGEDKTLKIFKDIFAKEPIETFYFDSWVTSCALGHLKIPNERNVIYTLLIGTKSGILQLVHIKNGKPDVIWQQNTFSEINDIKVGDVTHDGFNEIIVACDDSYIKIYNAEGKRIRFIKVPKDPSKSKKKRLKTLNRAKSLLIADIDGDNANEIVAGCADGSLLIYHNKSLNSNNFELKWKIKFSSSIKDICSFIDPQSNIRHIIAGGYDRAIRNLTDFEWGEKSILKIPRKFKIPKIAIKNSIQKVKQRIVPTNLRDHIIKYLEKHEFFLTLDLLYEKLKKKGYSKNDIDEEIEQMKSMKTMKYEKVDVHAWSLSNESVEDAIIDDLPNSEQNNTDSHSN